MEISKGYVQALLLRNDNVGMNAIGRALLVLLKNQTENEKRAEATLHFNNRGFTPNDAKMGTSMANFYARNGYLTEAQLAYWQKPAFTAVGKIRILKYWRQFLRAANEKQQAKMDLAA